MSENIKLRGVANFRDFGGFAIAGRGAVRQGRLFRSANPAQATPSDVAALAKIPIRTVVDLRRRTERRLAPSPFTGSSGFRVLQNDDGDRDVSPHLEFFRREDLSADAVDAYLLGYYTNLPFEPRHRSLFAGTFDEIERAQGAILIHCTGGKDRTGFLAALIRTALGGFWDETVADFALTNDETLTPARVAAATARLQAEIGRAPGDAALRAYLGVWPHHLDAAFRSASDRCGSIEAYLASLGVDGARRNRLTQLLAS